MSFWEYVYRGFGGGNRDGGFGGGGFGGSDPDSWTTSDDMKNDYNDFVSTLPATGYDNSGSLIWRPKWSDAYSLFYIGENMMLSPLFLKVLSKTFLVLTFGRFLIPIFCLLIIILIKVPEICVRD